MTAMVSLWLKLNNRKKQTLASLLRGFVFFGIVFIITKFIGVTVCPAKNIFGILCFGCGMSEGFVKLLQFDLRGALDANVLSIPVFIMCVFYVIIVAIDTFSEKNYVEHFENILKKKVMWLCYVLILVVATILNNVDLF